MREYGIGRRKGASFLFTAADRRRITELLRAEGVDPGTSPQAWTGLTRAESLTIGRHDKATRAPVKRHRISIKALPGHSLKVHEREYWLPPRAHLDVDATQLGGIDHESLLVIENWEAFDQLDRVRLDFTRCGQALVIWRGDRESTVDAALMFVNASSLPVWAFVDYDPSGLVIAARLPRIAGVIAPPEQDLAARLQTGLAERYLEQLPSTQGVLDSVQNRDVQYLWSLIRAAGRALAQEVFIETHGA